MVTNRNGIPGDSNGTWYTSGIRPGTPAVTTLGWGPAEMDELADIVTASLDAARPAPASSGPSKARYLVDDGVAAWADNDPPSC